MCRYTDRAGHVKGAWHTGGDDGPRAGCLAPRSRGRRAGRGGHGRALEPARRRLRGARRGLRRRRGGRARRRARPRARGRVGRGRRRLALPSAPRLAVQRRARADPRAGQRRGRRRPTWSPSSTSARAAPRCSSSATAPARCSPRSTAIPRACCAACPASARGASARAVQSWRDQRELRELRLFLDTHGVDAASAGRIARHFGAGSIARLQREPYAICELDGIGFATADALARALDTPLDAPDRLAAGVLHALDQAQADGHCHLPRPELPARAARLLGGDVDVDDAIDVLAARGRVVVDDAGGSARRACTPSSSAWPGTCGGCSTTSRRWRSRDVERPDERRLRPQRRPVARRDAGARAPPLDPHRRARAPARARRCARSSTCSRRTARARGCARRPARRRGG